jgi:hypothetical protein
MRCPSCSYLRKKSECNPHWQCPNCEKAYNKFQSKPSNESSNLGGYASEKYRTKDFITNCISNLKGILKIAFSIFLLFWGIEEFLIEGVYYTSNYYQYFQTVLGNDLFIFSVLILFLLFIIGVVIFIGRKVVGNY